MPNNYINNLSTKYKISKGDLEKDWQRAEEIVDKNKYGDNYYAIVTSVFKKIINNHYSLNENIIKNMNFKQYCLYDDLIHTNNIII